MINLQHSNLEDGTLRDLAPDLTPMLDILFILLVFFMLTAGAVFQSLDLNLPSSVAEELEIANAPKHVLIEIRHDSYAIDGKQVGSFVQFKQTAPALIRAKLGHKIIVASDKDVSVERLLRVLTFMQTQGIEAANILMQNEASK